jgi:HD-like signal output (HDOD) protein
VLRALLFLIVVVALALIVLSLLRRTQRPAPRVTPLDDTGEPRALPPPAGHVDRTLSRATAIRLLYELAFDAPLESTVPAEQVRVVMAVSSSVQAAAADPKHAPRRPSLLPELVRAGNDSDATRRELARVIERDAALVASLLRLANSPVYRRGPQPVESLDRVLAALGTNGTRSLAAAALVQPAFHAADSGSWRFAEIVWEHTQRSAAAAEVHAAAVESSDPFAAQLAALVMGLGTVLVYRHALEHYGERRMQPEPTAVASLLEEQASKVARQIAASWELSDRVVEALDEQPFERPASSLGRSLEFGRLVGALGVLRSYDRIDDEAGLATLAAAGGVGDRFERLWGRLTWPPEHDPAELLPQS